MVITWKNGEEEGGWCSRVVRKCMKWECVEDNQRREAFLVVMFYLVIAKDAWIAECIDRDIEDKMVWLNSKCVIFIMKSIYSSLSNGSKEVFPSRYFVLSASDLEEWYQNPESFHHEQDMVQWTEKLRPCAEALYIVLFENHSQLLGPVVVSILQEAMRGCPTSVTEITPGLLLKDAAYSAAAHVYYELSNYLSFKIESKVDMLLGYQAEESDCVFLKKLKLEESL
ncbi:hypothetical protein CK203_047350 [Vitis vinifera]|uniref:Uncharacterized protein n=1 Tax=Vitis vinifera TaxID=29760 RepID=A0A438HHN8_VITVI|nr:hypothetical protein CK203_047350 [Vitis vinifera]